MRAAVRELKADGYLVKNKHRAGFVGDAAHLLQKVMLRLDAVYRLHHDSRQVFARFFYNRFKLLYVVVMERQYRAAQALGHAGGEQAREQMLSQSVFARKIGRQV